MKSHEVPLCSKYRHNTRDSFVKECPSSSQGCLTKIEAGGSISRTCAPVGIDDCKVANGVTYCYCSTDRCNTPDRRLSDPAPPPAPSRHHAVEDAHGAMDDEDVGAEGSGWPTPFYYDNYYESGAYDEYKYDPDTYDTEIEGIGYGGPDDYSDTTELPPELQNELDNEYKEIARQKNKNKHHEDRNRNTHDPRHRHNNDNIIENSNNNGN